MDGFSFRYAHEAGLTRYRLRELQRDGKVTQFTRGAFVRAEFAESLCVRARALSRALPPHVVVACRAAAWVWGLDVLPPGIRERQWPIDLLVPSGQTPVRRPGCVTRQSPLPPGDVTEEFGVRLTTRERTALDCARWLPRLEAVAALDQFLRAGVNKNRLTVRAVPLAGQRNVQRLREVINLSDPGAMLPGESWTRTIIMDTGFPRPRTQIPVPRTDGSRFFLDMGYEPYRVAVEYDGEEHHSDIPDRAHDDRRRRWLRAQGWEIIVVTREDILFRPRPFLEALLTVLLERGWQPTDELMIDICNGLRRIARHRAA